MRSCRGLPVASPLLRTLILVATAQLVAWPAAAAGVPADALVEIGRIPLPASPTFLALSPDGSRLVVPGLVVGPTGDVSSGTVAIVDTVTSSVVGYVPLGEGFAFEAAVTPDGSRAYVAISKASGRIVSAGSNRVDVIDLQTLQVVDRIEIVPPGNDFGPIRIALTPDGRNAYVTHRASGEVLALGTDPASALYHTVFARVATGGTPIGLDVTPDGSRVYVALRASSEVAVIDTDQNVEVARIPVGIGPSSSLTAVAITPGGDRAFVNYALDSRFTAIDTDPSSPTYHGLLSMEDTGSGRGLYDVAVSSDGKLVFMVSNPTEELLVVDADPASDSSGLVLGAVAVGGSPLAVALQDQPQAVAYVTNSLDESVSVVGVSCGLALEAAVSRLYIDDFSEPTHQRALEQKLASLRRQLDSGNSCAVENRLRHDILPKTDGEPRPPDWVTGRAQVELAALIDRCLTQTRASCARGGR